MKSNNFKYYIPSKILNNIMHSIKDTDLVNNLSSQNYNDFKQAIIM